MSRNAEENNVNPIEYYIDQLYGTDEQLLQVEEGIRSEGMPEISIAPAYGRLLTMLASLSGARAALEIGALGGYSGVCIARGLAADGMLTSLEVDPRFAAVAERHLAQAGLSDKVQYRIGDARESLRQLEAEGASFDFFFIDADKGGYPHYLEIAIRLSRPGAVIIGDNVLLRGRVADPLRDSPSVNAMREFNARIAEDPRLQSTILPGYDGLAIARVKL